MFFSHVYGAIWKLIAIITTDCNFIRARFKSSLLCNAVKRFKPGIYVGHIGCRYRSAFLQYTVHTSSENVQLCDIRK
jgi:hypothetical protein